MNDFANDDSDIVPMTPGARLRAYLSMTFIDHGFIRWAYCNTHRLTPEVWRTAQPLPRHLRWAKSTGIRTIVNLRGRSGNAGHYRIEREICGRLGLKLVDFPMVSRDMPSRGVLIAAKRLFREIEYPILMHCKSGADRTGFMATLFLHLHRGIPIETARRQLSWRYGHVSRGRTGMLDYFFESYEKDTGGDAKQFDDWVERVYDPAVLKRSFRDSRFANFILDRLLGRG